MKKQRGFTLIELMATIAIFLVATLIISGVFIQGYRIFNRTENFSAIEDEFRNAILNIETTMKAHRESEIVVYEKNNKRITLNSRDYPKEKQQSLICVLPKSIAEKTIYIQAENLSGITQLLEVKFKDSDNDKFLDTNTGSQVSITSDDIKVLINKIDTTTGNVVVKNNNGIVSITVPGISKGNQVASNAYSASFSANENKDINMSINEGGETAPPGGDGDGSGGIPPDGNGELEGIEIEFISKNSWGQGNDYNEDWAIKIINNSGKDLWDWQLITQFNTGRIINFWNGTLTDMGNNKFKMFTPIFNDKLIKNGTVKVINGQIKGESISKVKDYDLLYEVIINPLEAGHDVGNNINVTLDFELQWDSGADWKMHITNNSGKNIKQWDLAFDFEKDIIAFGRGRFEKISDGRYKLSSTVPIENGSTVSLVFQSRSPVVNRNFSNVVFTFN